MRFRIWPGLRLTLGLVLLSTAVQADPIRVTSGHLGVSSTDPPHFFLASDSFDLGGLLMVEEGSLDIFRTTCTPVCVPGTAFNGSASASGVERLAEGSGTVAGVEYDELFFTGSLNFSAPDAFVPSAGPPGTGVPEVMLPFAFSGHITAFVDAARTGPPVLDSALVGSGTATFAFTELFPRRPDGGLEFAQVDYEFESANVVPEPATLLLFGTGGAILAWRRKRSCAVR